MAETMTPEQTADFLHRLISQLEASNATLRRCALEEPVRDVKNRMYALCDRNDALLGEIARVQLADNPPGFSELLG
jgi:hypothetical protein